MTSSRRMPKNLDRRVVRTRQLLRDALMSLILEKGYDAITIQEITDRANLGRATFYIHYDDKEDLLVKSLKETFDDLVKMVKFEPGKDSITGIGLAFHHAGQHRDFYRVMLGGQGTGPIVKQIRDYMAEVSQDRIRQLQAQFFDSKLVPTISIDILAQYVSGALLSLITWWLETDTPYSADEMAAIFQKLSADVVRSAFLPGDKTMSVKS